MADAPSAVYVVTVALAVDRCDWILGWWAHRKAVAARAVELYDNGAALDGAAVTAPASPSSA